MDYRKLTQEQKIEVRKKAIEHCTPCVKFVDGECTVLTELFHLWSTEETCWARETDPKKYKQTVMEIETYVESTGAHYPSIWIPEEKERLDKLIYKKKEQAYEGLEEVYNEEVNRRNVKKGGGGEKNKDGSPFGPQQMKNNKFMHRRNDPRRYSGWYD